MSYMYSCELCSADTIPERTHDAFDEHAGYNDVIICRRCYDGLEKDPSVRLDVKMVTKTSALVAINWNINL